MTGGAGGGVTGWLRGGLCAVLLAAGEGSRLRPLTESLPKALCPVGNVPMLDRALRHVADLGMTGPGSVAVNASWLGEQVAAHVGTRAHLSLEPPPPLGTSGGVARLRGWVGGRAVLVGNADAYLADGSIGGLVAGWDGETVRLLAVPAAPGTVDAFGGYRFAGFSLLPWPWVAGLPDQPDELVRTVWRPAEAAGRLEVVEFAGYFRDTGTLGDYLAANRHAAATAAAAATATDDRTGGNLVADGATVTGHCRESVIGAGARVHGRLTRAVVWPGGYVGPEEHLVDAVRVGTGLTVPPRPE